MKTRDTGGIKMYRWVENYLYGLGLRKKIMIFVTIVLVFLALQNMYIIRRDYMILNSYNEDNQNYGKISKLKTTLASNNAYLNDYFDEPILRTKEGFNESTLEILVDFNRTGYEVFEMIDSLKVAVKSLDEYLWIQATSNACDIYREEANTAIREHNNGITEHQDKVNKMYGYITVYMDEFLMETSNTREIGYTKLFTEWRNSKNFTILLLMIMIIIIYMVGRIFSRYITNNIENIIKLQGEIGTGDFIVEVKDQYVDDEMGQLQKSLNKMQKNIKHKIDSLNEKALMQQRLYREELLNMQMQKELNEAKYAMLQSQINPHFLFNTLNIISRKAMFKKSEETVELINALSQLFRHSLIDVSKKVTLQKELDIIQEYLYIQKTRFGDRLEIEFINEAQNSKYIMVPPLILQPIVENAIIHGIEKLEENGKISIIVGEDIKNIDVVISDNGPGISADKLKLIQSDLFMQESIGLKNVKQRMKYFSSKKNFFIKSNQTGTCIRLIFKKD